MKGIPNLINKRILNKLNLVLSRPLVNPDTDTQVYFDVYKKLDYTRSMTFNLIANEINSNNLDGNVAELGVYQGQFAQLINATFPQKKLFLFDTFQGFSKEDFTVKDELDVMPSVIHDFDNTSADKVLSIMPHKENCVIKKGYFPDTTAGCENEIFCFVSIDADLFKPIYDGLVFFYDRLVKGGYIMVHDYNNSIYKGAKQAVKKFIAERNITIVPIADGWGTAIIVK
jgi:O-methyltransferase